MQIDISKSQKEKEDQPTPLGGPETQDRDSGNHNDFVKVIFYSPKGILFSITIAKCLGTRKCRGAQNIVCLTRSHSGARSNTG